MVMLFYNHYRFVIKFFYNSFQKVLYFPCFEVIQADETGNGRRKKSGVAKTKHQPSIGADHGRTYDNNGGRAK